MSKPDAVEAAPAAGEPDRRTQPKKGKKLLLIVPVVLALLLAGGWFSGVLPSLLGLRHATPAAVASAPAELAANLPRVPVFAELPLIVTNLNVTGKRSVFVKMTAKLEVARPEDQAVVTAAMPRLLDLFQTYLRETRPEELQGAAGTWRLRQELIARANIAANPAHVLDVLFTELLVQ